MKPEEAEKIILSDELEVGEDFAWSFTQVSCSGIIFELNEQVDFGYSLTLYNEENDSLDDDIIDWNENSLISDSESVIIQIKRNFQKLVNSLEQVNERIGQNSSRLKHPTISLSDLEKVESNTKLEIGDIVFVIISSRIYKCEIKDIEDDFFRLFYFEERKFISVNENEIFYIIPSFERWVENREDDLWCEFCESGAYDEYQEFDDWCESKYWEIFKSI